MNKLCTLVKLAEVLSPDEFIENTPSHPWVIGGHYLIRSVTYHYTGRLIEVSENELVLTDAAWIADTGRFADAITSANFSEVEPYPDGARVIIGRAAIVDATLIPSLPRKQK